MADTTIHHDAAVRDRLATQAADRGMSLRQYVTTLAEERTTAVRAERAVRNIRQHTRTA